MHNYKQIFVPNKEKKKKVSFGCGVKFKFLKADLFAYYWGWYNVHDYGETFFSFKKNI